MTNYQCEIHGKEGLTAVAEAIVDLGRGNSVTPAPLEMLCMQHREVANGLGAIAEALVRVAEAIEGQAFTP